MPNNGAEATAGTAQAPKRRARTPSAQLREALLGAAETVLARDGLSGLTMRAVTLEAGVAPMSVYNSLGGKTGLLTALLIRGFDRLRIAMEGGDEKNPCARLYACCLRYREFALGNRSCYALLFEDATSGARDHAEVRKHAAACFRVLVREVELAAAAGMPAASDPRETAHHIWSAMHGSIELELKGLGQTPDPAMTFRAFLNLLLRG